MTVTEARTGTGEWTRPGVFEVASGVHRIPLPLPNDGLRAVNVYVVAADAGPVLVDSPRLATSSPRGWLSSGTSCRTSRASS